MLKFKRKFRRLKVKNRKNQTAVFVKFCTNTNMAGGFRPCPQDLVRYNVNRPALSEGMPKSLSFLPEDGDRSILRNAVTYLFRDDRQCPWRQPQVTICRPQNYVNLHVYKFSPITHPLSPLLHCTSDPVPLSLIVRTP